MTDEPRGITEIDGDGQPIPLFNRSRRVERDVAEMLGLVKGVLFDGVVTPQESLALFNWAEDHPDVVAAWPGRVLNERLRKVFADGVVTTEEQADLAELLELIVGGEAGMLGGTTTSTALPLDAPPPVIAPTNRVFVLTGKFALGPRIVCEDQVRRCGGRPEGGVTKRTDYLVIGTFGSRDWRQTSYGRKIEKAVGYREEHGRPAIVSEDHWAATL